MSCRDDRNEWVRFVGQAYFREAGSQLVARGEIIGFSIHAPAVKRLIVNSEEAAMHKVGGYVLYGKARPPHEGAKAAPKVVEPPTDQERLATTIVSVSLPQQYVNLDTVTGGWIVVRLTNRSTNLADGTVTIAPGAGLKTATSRNFNALPPAHRLDLGFQLTPTGAKPGTLVPVEVVAKTQNGTHRIKTDVAVGVVLQEVPATYTIRHYDYSQGMPGRPKADGGSITQQFDYLLAWAPGYTLRIDKFSGGWLTQAKLHEISNDENGHPVVAFFSVDGKKTWQYVLTPGSAGDVNDGMINVPGVIEPNDLVFRVPISE